MYYADVTPGYRGCSDFEQEVDKREHTCAISSESTNPFEATYLMYIHHCIARPRIRIQEQALGIYNALIDREDQVIDV
jgi:hypothetical protein